MVVQRRRRRNRPSRAEASRTPSGSQYTSRDRPPVPAGRSAAVHGLGRGCLGQRCGIGSWGGPRPGLGGYVTGTGARVGARRRRALMLPILLSTIMWACCRPCTRRDSGTPTCPPRSTRSTWTRRGSSPSARRCRVLARKPARWQKRAPTAGSSSGSCRGPCATSGRRPIRSGARTSRRSASRALGPPNSADLRLIVVRLRPPFASARPAPELLTCRR